MSARGDQLRKIENPLEHTCLIFQHKPTHPKKSEQKATMAAMQESYERQGQSLSNLQRNYNQIEQEKDQYLAIFAKHNFDKLATAKPGLMELRFNNGTQEVFKDIENDSKAISNLDSPDVP